jgi:hypothetical protein
MEIDGILTSEAPSITAALARRQLAIALLMQDESQIEYYEKRLRDMPLPVPARHSIKRFALKLTRR